MTDSLVRIGLLFAFVAHLFVAIGYGWVSPQGFPIGHLRFWLNGVLPWGVVVVVGLGLVGLMRSRLRGAGQVALLLGCAWVGGSLAARFFFPLSLRVFWGLGLGVAALEFGFGAWLLRGDFPQCTAGKRNWFAARMLALLVGVFPVYVQVPAPALTQPVNGAALELAGAEPEVFTGMIKLGGGVRYTPSSAELVLRLGKVSLFCSPLLEFDRVSPDRFWSLLAPWVQAKPSLRSVVVNPAGEFLLQYAPQPQANQKKGRQPNGNRATVKLLPINEAGVVECITQTVLAEDVYTHLNSFCVVTVLGHQELTLSFSPCPDVRVEVLPADYPTGRPARFAFLTAQGEFKIVEATSGEKGPFHLLGEGQLSRGEPLSIRFYDRGKLLTTLTLDDWAQQLSTDLSPTAGWGVPVNAIEFHCSGEKKGSPVNLYFTLAATSVGRGWESVGHRAGTYQNRVSFQLER